MIPTTFEAWKNCIEHDCKIELTPAFVQERLTVYLNSNHPETKKFIATYGEHHLKNIILWFQQL